MRTLAPSQDGSTDQFRVECALGGGAWWEEVGAGVMVNTVNVTGFRTGDLSALGVRESPGWVN